VETVKALLQKYLNKENRTEFIRFALVGVVNTVVDFTVFVVLTKLVGVAYLIGQIVGYSAGVTNSFIMNRKWTFNKGTSKEKMPKEIIQFIVINLLSLGTTLLLMYILVDHYAISTIIAKIIVIIVGQVVNYTGYKFWVFK
jgi:putative flippase GtrA